MDIKIEKKKYLVPRKYWAWIGGGAVLIAVLIWLGLGNFSSTLKVDRKGLSIGTVEKAQFNDYVSVDGQVVPISVVQISSEEGGIVLEKVVDEGAHVNKGDVIVKLSNSNLDLEILNAESELAEKQDMLRNTQISMEQDRLNNSNEELSLSQDVITKRRSYQHQAALHKEELNSRDQVAPKDILIHQKGNKPTPYVTLQQAADTTRCIHIAYVAEGYTDAEMPVFLKDAQEATEAIFAHEPFKSMRDRFNIVAVKSPSKQSGPSIPAQGIWHETALSSHFDTFYSDRYLTTLHLKDLHNWLAGTPYEHIIVLVNSDKYGGGGILNSYNLTTCHQKWFKPVVVHEFGHSFAGLADEYAYEQEQIPMYPHDVEPWEKNITTLADFHGKWENMIDKKTKIPTPLSKKEKEAVSKVGVFEGAGYSLKGVYRGVQDCRMRINETPEFCAVCKKALQDLIDFYTK